MLISAFKWSSRPLEVILSANGNSELSSPKRLNARDVMVKLFNQIADQANEQDHLSDENFIVGGTLIPVRAGHQFSDHKDSMREDGRDGVD